MLISYRRTGGVLALLTLAAVAIAAAVLTAAVAAVVLIVVLAIAAAAVLTRALLPTSWRRHGVAPPAPWPGKTIDTSLVKPTGSSDERDVLRIDSDKG